MRKAYGLLVLLLATGLVMAQKDKDKDKKDTKAGTKATLVSADPDKKMLVVTIDGKKREFLVDKSVSIVGPKGGKSEGLKDDRLTPGAELMVTLSADGKSLKEVRLPYRKSGGKDKGTKDKDKAAKDKGTTTKDKAAKDKAAKDKG